MLSIAAAEAAGSSLVQHEPFMCDAPLGELFDLPLTDQTWSMAGLFRKLLLISALLLSSLQQL